LQEPEHRATIPLVEMALALMRLSTEKFFVLLSLYVAFLLFRVPPRAAAALVALNARASSAFARLILYSFPAVCWVYGAGFTFSTFVSGEAPLQGVSAVCVVHGIVDIADVLLSMLWGSLRVCP
jgi:hypothetical protein